MKNKKAWRYSLNSKAFIIGAVVIVLLVNAILIALNDKISLEIDLTKDQIFALTDESKEIVDKIDEKTEILMLTTGTENETLTMVKNVLEEYTQRNSKISVREVDVVKNPAEVQAYASELSQMGIGSLIIKQSDSYETVNSQEFFSQNGYSYIERMVTTKLASFIDGMTISEITFITGHGEQISPNSTQILEMSGYTIKQLDMLSEELPTDSNSLVVISAPVSDFSPEEIDKLDAYLDRGGNVQLYFDPLYGGVNLTNLENYLVEDWGIIRHQNVIFDTDHMIENSYFMMAELGDHDIIDPITDSQKRVGFGPANAIEKSTEVPPSVELSTVLASYKSAYAKSGLESLQEGTMAKASGDVDGPFDVMVAAERTTSNVDNENVTGRLIVGGSVLIFDQLAADTRFANEDLLLNTVSWMKGASASITVRAKALPGGEMVISKQQFWTWFITLVVVIPLVILVAGIVVFTKRRYK